jgi:hypothetical protein
VEKPNTRKTFSTGWCKIKWTWIFVPNLHNPQWEGPPMVLKLHYYVNIGFLVLWVFCDIAWQCMFVTKYVGVWNS